MEINKQLFEDVLSGKLKGTFVLRNQLTCNSDELTRNTTDNKSTYPYYIKNWSYTPSGIYQNGMLANIDIVDFIPDTDMRENELIIEIPDGKIVDWDESKKQNKIVFKKKDTRPRSWEEYCKQHNTTVTECYFLDNESNVRTFGWHPSVPSDYYRNTLPSKELTEAFRAMMQLMSLRQAWIGDWKPDWEDITKRKYCLCQSENIIRIYDFWTGNRVLSFPTEEMATDFMNTFKDLLEIAKPLI